MNEELLKYLFFSDNKEKNKIKYYKLQASIIDKLDKHKFALCFDEVGMGKTIQGIYAIWNCIQKKTPEETVNILIVAPNEMLAKKWKQEIYDFLGVDFNIIVNRDEPGVYNMNYDSTANNLYITYNSSNYKNLGITRLTNYKGNGNVLTGECYINVPLTTDREWLHYHMNKQNIDKWVKEKYENLKQYEYFKDEEDLRRYAVKLSYYKNEKKYKCYDDKKYIYKSKWDLIIIDEVHLINSNYFKAMTKECVEVGKNFYCSFLGWHEAEQLLMLTATPIKSNIKDNKYYDWLLEIAMKLVPDIDNDIEIRADKMLEFDIDLPYQRYFKEVVLETTEIKTRNIEFLEYQLTDELEHIWESKGYISPSNECGNVFLMIDKFMDINNCDNKIIVEACKTYDKNTYSRNDLKIIRKLDRKLDRLLDYIQNKLTTRIIIFCSRTDTRDYIDKVLKCLGIEVIVLVASDAERNEKIEEFNQHDGKKALVSTWQIGNVGINLHGADTVICYEPNTNIDKLEQGLGRIDRIGLGFDDINMIYLKPRENSSRYDNYKINIIFDRLFNQQLPNIPSKNLLFTTSYLNEHISLTEQKYNIYSNIKEQIKNVKGDIEIDKNDLQLLCKEDEFILIRDELFIQKKSCKKSDIVTKVNEYKRTNDNIKLFIEKATTDRNINKSPYEILKEAIYYYDKGQLEVISVQQLIEKAKNYTPPSEKTFNEALNFLKNNVTEVIKDDEIVNKIEKRYHYLLADTISNLLYD